MIRVFFAAVILAGLTTSLLHLGDGALVAIFVAFFVAIAAVNVGKLTCEHCGKRVKLGASVCHHCGRDVESLLDRLNKPNS